MKIVIVEGYDGASAVNHVQHEKTFTKSVKVNVSSCGVLETAIMVAVLKRAKPYLIHAT